MKYNSYLTVPVMFKDGSIAKTTVRAIRVGNIYVHKRWNKHERNIWHITHKSGFIICAVRENKERAILIAKWLMTKHNFDFNIDVYDIGSNKNRIEFDMVVKFVDKAISHFWNYRIFKW